MGLIKHSLFSFYSLAAFAAVFLGIGLLPIRLWPLIWLTAVLLLFAAVVHAARILLRAKDRMLADATAKWNKERERLKAELVEARRHYVDEEVCEKLRKLVGELSPQEKAALEIFCTKGSAQDVQLDPAIPIEAFRAVRTKAVNAGVMRFDEALWRDSRGKAYWVIPAYRAPLKKILGEARRFKAANVL
jgi:hypothetical protein